MKKTFLACCILFANYSHSQIEKNTFFVGGFYKPRTGYSYGGDVIGLTPSIGYMLSSKWAIGTEFSYNFAGA